MAVSLPECYELSGKRLGYSEQNYFPKNISPIVSAWICGLIARGDKGIDISAGMVRIKIDGDFTIDTFSQLKELLLRGVVLTTVFREYIHNSNAMFLTTGYDREILATYSNMGLKPSGFGSNIDFGNATFNAHGVAISKSSTFRRVDDIVVLPPQEI